MEQQNKKKPQAIFVIGGPGCGKGTQCQIMKDSYSFLHLSTGSLLRQYVESNAQGSKQIAEKMKNGTLISSQTIVQLMRNKIESSFPKFKIFILDGFPRNHQNHDVWVNVIKDKIDVAMVLYIDCNIQILRKRLLERAKTSGRADDNPQTIQKRFKTFQDYTLPVIQKYRKQHPKFISIDGMGTKQQVAKEIQKALKNLSLI